MSGVLIKQNEVENLKQEYQEFIENNLADTEDKVEKPEENDVPQLCEY